MGQVALGFRSLLIKGAIFFVMAALLAWALGGTLFPRAEVVDYDAITFEGRDWFWRLTVGGRESGARWTFMSQHGEDGPEPIDERHWVETAGPVVTEDAIYYAGLASFAPGQAWRLERIIAPSAGGGDVTGYGVASLVLPDRLAVEHQLARVRSGLPLEDPAARPPAEAAHGGS
jgi:hypothetical protein